MFHTFTLIVSSVLLGIIVTLAAVGWLCDSATPPDDWRDE